MGKTSQKWKKYKVDGDKIKRAKTCPRCGPGVFLMDKKDRIYCGRCHYTEFKTGDKKGNGGKENNKNSNGDEGEGKDKKEKESEKGKKSESSKEKENSKDSEK